MRHVKTRESRWIWLIEVLVKVKAHESVVETVAVVERILEIVALNEPNVARANCTTGVPVGSLPLFT